MKPCMRCERVFPASAEYFYHTVRARGLAPYCKDCAREKCRAYRSKNKDAHNQWQREYYARNATRFAELRHLRRNAKYRDDPQCRLQANMSRGIRRSLWGLKGGRSWLRLVGYTTDELRAHLERQFLPGMTWDNYGEWHIDHIIPLSAFNYTKPEHIDFGRAWALSNLRPLWAAENMAKGARIPETFQPFLQIGVAA